MKYNWEYDKTFDLLLPQCYRYVVQENFTALHYAAWNKFPGILKKRLLAKANKENKENVRTNVYSSTWQYVENNFCMFGYV